MTVDTWHEIVQACHSVEAEVIRAVNKHGIEKTPANPDMSNPERLVILVEEVGEAANAMTYDGPTDNLEAELIQIAAMAVASVAGLRLKAKQGSV